MCNIEYENNNARSMWFSQATFAYVFYCRSILEILQSTIMLTRWMMIYEWFSVQRAKLPKISSAYPINGSCVLTFNVSFMIRFFLYYKDCTIYDFTLRVIYGVFCIMIVGIYLQQNSWYVMHLWRNKSRR